MCGCSVGTNPSESLGADKMPCFCLEEQLVDIVIDRKHQGGFEQHAFMMNNLIKHADAKAYNRHVATGRMRPGELILVGQEALGLLLLENYRAP